MLRYRSQRKFHSSSPPLAMAAGYTTIRRLGSILGEEKRGGRQKERNQISIVIRRAWFRYLHCAIIHQLPEHIKRVRYDILVPKLPGGRSDQCSQEPGQKHTHAIVIMEMMKSSSYVCK